MFDSVAGGYGTGRQAASLVGFLVWNLCMGILDSTTTSVSDEAQEGTLENVLISPLTPLTVFSLRIAATFSRHALETIALGIVLVLILQLPITLNAPAFLVIFQTALAVGGVGLALGGLAMVYKNVASLVGVVTLLALFFTGAIIPLNDLGIVFSVLKYLLPTTWGIDALRLTIVHGGTWASLWESGTFLGLSLQAAVFIGIGMIVFNWGFRRAQRQGSLGTY
jgi:ABC-2 type transport system permease protein